MPHRFNKVDAQFTSGERGKCDILGLESLNNSLEKDYFSNVTIRNSAVCCEQNNLVIELNCALSLHEVLFHIQQGTWGTVQPVLVNKGLTVLSKHMQSIREINNTFIDVEELSFFLKDCSIIIKKLGPESVEHELDTILSTLAENYVYITRHLSETPSEIFIPVYEEVSSGDHITRLAGPLRIDQKGYYSYWGLYFERDIEAVIYDLEGKNIISGDLNLLNL
ncbi:hypothetical protein [uncultured Muriicola sp.]|uniref:hypothetical protein n=1 Tax=uncultured Muriicola sp. TaxID=1583102 RepID=UPI002639D5A1|nr:hypothetical protein [uncultured Muriicola sp.]